MVVRGERGRSSRRRSDTSVAMSSYAPTLVSSQNAMFAVSISGVSLVVGQVRQEVQRRCQDILNWEGLVNSMIVPNLLDCVCVCVRVYEL